LDNELSASESRKMATWLDRDPEAAALYAELQDTARVLKGNELEMKLPESREFYWSKIQRAISQAPVESRPRFFGYPAWMRVFGPAVGLAVLLVAALSLVKLGTAPSSVSYLHETEIPLEETAAISFHSQSAGMSVVWVQSQSGF
jgi:anti-sigma factor RsiW